MKSGELCCHKCGTALVPEHDEQGNIVSRTYNCPNQVCIIYKEKWHLVDTEYPYKYRNYTVLYEKNNGKLAYQIIHNVNSICVYDSVKDDLYYNNVMEVINAVRRKIDALLEQK